MNKVNMTLYLTPHWGNRFQEVLSFIPHTQNCIGVDKWHREIGEQRSMEIALPRDRGLFRHIMDAFRHAKVNMVTLIKGVHQALKDFSGWRRNWSGSPLVYMN